MCYRLRAAQNAANDAFLLKCSLKDTIGDLSGRNMDPKLLRRSSGLQALLRATAMDRSANGQSGPGIEDEAVGGVDRPKLSAGGFHTALLLRRSLWWLLCVH